MSLGWRSNPQIEEMLEPSRPARPVDDWRRVKAYLAESFCTFLGQPAEPVWEPLYEDISPTWGFAFGLRSGQPLGGALGVEWYAVVSSDGDSRVCAIVLLFAHDQRLIPHGRQEYLYFEFVVTPHGNREWRSLG